MTSMTSDQIAIALAAGVTALAVISLLLTLRRLSDARRCAAFTELAAAEASDGLVVQSLDGTILWANRAYCRMMQRNPREVIGRNPLSFAVPDDIKPTDREIAAFNYLESGEDREPLHLRRNIRKSGEEFWNQISVSLHSLPDGKQRAVLVCRDATAQVDKENELRAAHAEVDWMARHDPMTGLANRGEFLRFTAAAMATRTSLGVLHIDLDHFKETNDSLGHAAGDAVICHVGDTLAAVSRETDLAARLGGDEFVLVCPGMPLEALEARGNEIIARLERPLVWEDHKIACSASIGGAVSEDADVEPVDILCRSDVALYEAKRQGRGVVRLYDGEIRTAHRASLARRSALREAVSRRKLDFVYQPTQALATGEIRGFETLVRWSNGPEGMLSPADFLGVAREMGLMAELDFCAMDAAIRMHVAIRETTGNKMVLGFNASPELLMHPQFLPRLTRAIEHHNISPRLIAIELLEAVFLDGVATPGRFPDVVLDLCQIGFSVLLDDLGTGHAGLANLARLPVMGVKLDRSLIAGIESDPTRLEIVRALHGLGQRIGIHTVAEGIETAETAAALNAIGPFVGQGHWISPPIAEGDVLGWLAGQRVDPSPRWPLPHQTEAPRARREG